MSEHSKLADAHGPVSSVGEEIFIFTCVGSWILSTAPLKVGFLRSSYQGYLNGVPIFNLKQGKKDFTVSATHLEITVKTAHEKLKLSPGESVEFPLSNLSGTEVHHDKFAWKFSNVRAMKLRQVGSD